MKNILKVYGDIILKYSQILVNVLDKENLNIFYHNINSLKTGIYKLKIKDLLRDKVVAGIYRPDNSIKIMEKYKFSLPHELTHLSSTIVKDDGVILSGFHQVVGKHAWGHGINEGYTQYFTEKYFRDSFPDIPKSYELEMEIAQKLICAVGEKEVKNLYFHADLKGLINLLAKYSSLDEAKEFIGAVDFVRRYIYNFAKSKWLLKMLEIKLQKINYILLKCFLNKQKEDRSLGVRRSILKEKREEFDNYLGDELIMETIFGKNTLDMSVDEDSLKRELRAKANI